MYFFFLNITLILQDILDGIDFARGDSNSNWGSVRAEMGHPDPFDLKFISIGNQECGNSNYKGVCFLRLVNIFLAMHVRVG